MMKLLPVAMGALAVTVGAAPLTPGAQEKMLPSATTTNLGKQLEAAMTAQPYETPLPDHLWAMADDKSVVFLHFDKPIGQATRLLYVGYGIKGRWCAEDQQRVEAIAGKGFTHFHRIAKVATPDAGHGGGKPGEAGYWLKHVAVGPAFKMPWGDVAMAATDQKFMPTAAPKCSK
jgi:hypothetical protein